jgi:hypothetical protein
MEGQGGPEREMASQGVDGARLGSCCREMCRPSRKQRALAGSMWWGDMQEENRRGSSPALEGLVVGPAQLTPSPQKQPHDLG